VSTTLREEIADERRAEFVPITVEQFREMIRSGIIPDGAPIELIDGMMVWKDRGGSGGQPMGHDPRHAILVKRLVRLLQTWVTAACCHLQSQLPVTLTDMSEIEPDLAVIRGFEEDFGSRHPGPGDIAVAIEIANSSLKRDRTKKLRLYAIAEVPVYWIVNLQSNQIEVYTQPDATQQTYEFLATYHPVDTFKLELGGQELTIDLKALLA